MMLPSIPHEEVVKIVERLPEDQQRPTPAVLSGRHHRLTLPIPCSLPMRNWWSNTGIFSLTKITQRT